MNNYDDIINEPMPKLIHERMSLISRAAQFAPYAALNGYGEIIEETARRVDKKYELTEDEKSILDSKLQIILQEISNTPEITITYFIKDKYKNGGVYETISSNLIKIDKYKNNLILKDKTIINIDNILDIESPLIKQKDY